MDFFPYSARFHPHSAIDLIQTRLDLIRNSARSHPHSARSHPRKFLPSKLEISLEQTFFWFFSEKSVQDWRAGEQDCADFLGLTFWRTNCVYVSWIFCIGGETRVALSVLNRISRIMNKSRTQNRIDLIHNSARSNPRLD
jgi:hypothetical protein